MKKIFSIAVTTIILISGMHLAVAKHYCQGELAAMRITLIGENATCGMEESTAFDSHVIDGFSAKCCSNESTPMGVDQNYDSFHQEFNTLRSLSLFTYVPSELVFSIQNSSIYNFKSIIPPDNVLAGPKGPADICVFRI